MSLANAERKNFHGIGVIVPSTLDFMEEVSSSPEETENVAVKEAGIVGPVFMTLFILAVIGGLIYLPFYAEQNPLLEILASDAWWVPNVGEYHPLILHLPIGIVALTVFMEVCGWLSFGRYRPLTGVGLLLAFLSGVVACVTGLFDLKVEGMVHDDWGDDMFKHMWMGIAFVVVLGLAFLAKIWGSRNGTRRWIYGVLLFGTAGILGYGANFGGRQTHGACPVENTIKGLSSHNEVSGPVKDGGSMAQPAKDLLAFHDVVLPIMDDKCLACHSVESGKDKGELLMDTYANLLKGGESQDGDDYRTLVPGDAEKSYMIEVMMLPMDDDMHMPPRKKTQMEDYEVELMTWWVNNIPSNVVLEDQTLAEMGAPQNILDAATTMMNREEPESEPESVEMKEQEAAPENAPENVRVGEQEALKEDDSTDSEVTEEPEGETSEPELMEEDEPEELKADDLAALELPVAELVEEPSLVATLLTEEAVMDHLSNRPALGTLNSSEAEGVMNAAVRAKRLENLNLYGGKVSGSGLAESQPGVTFDSLYVSEPEVTLERRETLPKTQADLESN